MLGRVDYAALRLDEVMKIHSSTKLQVGKHDEPGLLVLESLRVIAMAMLDAQATTLDLGFLPGHRKAGAL